ncbi:MAG: hypothetical protein ABSG33_01795 [Candidatus Bathyarchaeia archaeon]|jgi:hypothetical protein
MNKKITAVLAIVLVIIVAVVAVFFVISNSSKPTAVFTYLGENYVPAGITNFPDSNLTFYSWHLKITNLNAQAGIGTPSVQALQPLVSKYPELATIPISGSDQTTLNMDVTGYPGSGSLDNQVVVLFANSPLSSDQITSLTQDLNTYFSPAIIKFDSS